MRGEEKRVKKEGKRKERVWGFMTSNLEGKLLYFNRKNMFDYKRKSNLSRI